MKITNEVAAKITRFLTGKQAVSRKDILQHIGDVSNKSRPFDGWALKHLRSAGKGQGWTLPEGGVSLTVKHSTSKGPVPSKTRVRLSEEQKQTIANIAANDILLETPTLSTEVVRAAAASSGVTELPTSLVTVIGPYFNLAYQKLVNDLMLQPEPAIEVRTVDRGIQSFTTLELIQELLLRAPALVPLLPGFFAPREQLQVSTAPVAQPRVANDATTPVKPKALRVLVTGLLNRQASDFMARVKINHAIQGGKLQLSFINQDRHTTTFPSSVDLVVMFSKRSHALWSKLCDLYGTSKVVESGGHHDMEEKLMAMLPK